MAEDSPIAVLTDIAGVELAVQDGVAVPAGTPALLLAGKDGATARIVAVDALGNLTISGSITATNPSVDANGGAAPGSSTQIGGPDGSGNLQAARVFDADTGAGEELILGAVLRKSAPGGSVEAGTAADPLYITAVALPLPTGAATEITLAAAKADLDVISARTPALGQAAMVASSPVVIASNQTPVPISGSITATNPSVDLNAAAAPASSTQIGGTDGADLQAAHVYDLDSGGGTEYALGVSLRKSASGGSVEAGTVTDPLRVDPTGDTPQPVTGPLTDVELRASPVPISAAALPLPAGAATEATLALIKAKTDNLDVALSTRAVTGLTDAQLRATAVPVSGPLTDVELRATPVPVSGPLTDTELRATAVPISAAALPLPAGAATELTLAAISTKTPALGQAVMAASSPVVIASNQTPVPISGSITATNPSVDLNAAAAPASSTQIGGTDGADLQAAHVYDLDSGGGTEYALGVSLRKSASGGSVEAGTATDPLRVDPTGDTPQPVTGPLTDVELRASAVPISAASLPLPTGAATEVTLALIKAKTDNLDVALSTRAVTGLTDAQLRATAVPVSGPLTDVQLRASAVPVSAAALPLPTGASTEATLALIKAKTDNLDVALSTRAVTGLTDAELRATAVPVSGPLTDAQLRASAVPVSAAALPLPTGAATEATLALIKAKTDNIDVALSTRAVTGLTDTQLRATAVPVSGPLTDVQLRASAVPISAAALPLPTGAATEATLALIKAKTDNLDVALSTRAVTGLTDTQLRATPVPVSGSVTVSGTTRAPLDSDAREVLSNVTLSADGSAVYSGFGSGFVRLLVNWLGFTGSPTINFSLTEVDHGDGVTPVGDVHTSGDLGPVGGAGSWAMSDMLRSTDSVEVSWTITGGTLTGVYMTLVAAPCHTGSEYYSDGSYAGTPELSISVGGVSSGPFASGYFRAFKGYNLTESFILQDDVVLGVNLRGSGASGSVELGTEAHPVVTRRSRAATPAAITNIPSSATNVTLLSANADRVKATIYNNSTQKLLIKHGATATATSYTIRLRGGGTYELPEPVDPGRIDGYWESVNGDAQVTEWEAA